MSEHNSTELDALLAFLQRFLVYVSISAVFIIFALFIGVAGYHWIGGLGWVDSLLNASMILGGMGPVDVLNTTSAKVFASAYALFSGLIFVLAMGIVLTPMFQMLMKRFKLLNIRL